MTTKKQTIKTLAQRDQRLQLVTDRLLQRVEQRLEAVDPETAPASELRQLASAVKDIKAMQDADMEKAPMKITVEGLPGSMKV